MIEAGSDRRWKAATRPPASATRNLFLLYLRHAPSEVSMQPNSPRIRTPTVC